jgi:hypothetical protein
MNVASERREPITCWRRVILQKNGILSYTIAEHSKTRIHRTILPETLFYIFNIMLDKERMEGPCYPYRKVVRRKAGSVGIGNIDTGMGFLVIGR